MNANYNCPRNDAFRYCPKCGKTCGCAGWNCNPQGTPMRSTEREAVVPLGSRSAVHEALSPERRVKKTVVVCAPDSPVIVIPEEGRALDIRRPYIEGTAEPGGRVAVFLDLDESDAIADESGKWRAWFPGPLMEGSHTLTVAQADRRGREIATGKYEFTMEVKNEVAFITYLGRGGSPRTLHYPIMKYEISKTSVVELPRNDFPAEACDASKGGRPSEIQSVEGEQIDAMMPSAVPSHNEAAGEMEDPRDECGEQVDYACKPSENRRLELSDPDLCGAAGRRECSGGFRSRRPVKRRFVNEGLHGRGLYRYRKWWELNEVDIRVCGDLLTGTPIFTDCNTLRVVNDAYSYFIPLEKVDYIRTNDGLKSHQALDGVF